jgi:hypothetical protein
MEVSPLLCINTEPIQNMQKHKIYCNQAPILLFSSWPLPLFLFVACLPLTLVSISLCHSFLELFALLFDLHIFPVLFISAFWFLVSFSI